MKTNNSFCVDRTWSEKRRLIQILAPTFVQKIHKNTKRQKTEENEGLSFFAEFKKKLDICEGAICQDS